METLVHNWWAIALRGAIAILFGIVLLGWPGIGLAMLIGLFGAFALVDGILSLVSAVGRAREHRPWASLALVGITGIIAGLVAWLWPGITAAALVFVIAAWAVVTGVLEIVAAIELRKVIRNEIWMGLSGLFSVAFGVLLFLQPGTGALAVVWLIGLYAVLFGGALVALGFQLRHVGQRREVHA